MVDDLIDRELAVGEGSEGCRELAGAAGGVDELTGTSRRQSGLPGQPMVGGTDSPLLPQIAVERFDDGVDQLGVEHVQMAAEVGDAGLQSNRGALIHR